MSTEICEECGQEIIEGEDHCSVCHEKWNIRIEGHCQEHHITYDLTTGCPED